MESVVNVEKYLEGAAEIDRQRKAIPRVINALVAVAQNGTSEFGDGRVIVKVSLRPYYGDIALVAAIADGRLGFGENNKPNRKLMVRLSSRDGLAMPGLDNPDSLPVDVVLLLYKKLGVIIMATDAQLPEAHVAEHFNKIARVAEK